MRALLTDLEGTTTAIGFVKETLFPYARARLPAFLQAHAADAGVAPLVAEAAALAGVASGDLPAVIAALLGWIAADRKAPPLKALQGLLWAEGYASGSFRGHLYPDVLPALRRWRGAGLSLHVFSSGSVPAQKLLLGHSVEGDVSGLFTSFFDTRTGPKIEPGSYLRIAAAIGAPAAEMRFLSDAPAELGAARTAGFDVVQLCREGLAPDGRYPAVTSFDELV